MEWLLIPAFATLAVFIYLYARGKGRNETLTREVGFLRIREYANSFVGLRVEDAKETIVRELEIETVEESDWSEGEIEGVQLTAALPTHELTLFAVEGKVVTASVQILS